MFKHRDLARKCQLHEVLHKITRKKKSQEKKKKIPKIKVIRHLFGKKTVISTTQLKHNIKIKELLIVKLSRKAFLVNSNCFGLLLHTEAKNT